MFFALKRRLVRWWKHVVPPFKVSKPARIGTDRCAARGVVRDLSITGAALDIESQVEIPNKFTLTIPEDGLAIPCRMVWRRGSASYSNLRWLQIAKRLNSDVPHVF
jgi:hypothetical protein